MNTMNNPTLLVTISNLIIFFSVAELAARFPNIIGSEDCNQLQDEYDDYLVTPLSELPSQEEGINTFWSFMADMKDPFTEKARFWLLSKLAKSCTVIPSSNADPERIFSILKKFRLICDLNLILTLFAAL